MKKMVFWFTMALAALALLGSPVSAATDSPALSAADQAFLATLALPAGPPAPELTAKPPRGLEKATCTANCWDGSIVSCTGNACSGTNSSCPGTRGSVTCDGQTTQCPACPPPDCGPDFCSGEHEDECAAGCSPCTATFTCNFTFCIERCRCNFSTCPV